MIRVWNGLEGKWEESPPEPIYSDGFMTCPQGCDSKFTVLKTYVAHYWKEHG